MMKMIRNICVYFLASLVLSCGSKYALAQDTNEELYLVYIAKDEGNFDIYLNDLEGIETRLTDNPGFDWFPMWSEATNTIIHYAYVQDTFQIRQMDVKGNSLPLNTYKLEEYNLSPDGKKLVTKVSVGDYSKLVITALDGTQSKDITPSDSYNGRAKWAPDASSIAFISDREGNNEVYIYDLGTERTRRLTQNTTSEKYITWAPDGNRLAFTTEYYEEGKPDWNDVFVYDLVNHTLTQITDNTFEDQEIAWSPKGDKIAFHSVRDKGDQIYTMNIDGGDVRQITTRAIYHGEPEWVMIRRD